MPLSTRSSPAKVVLAALRRALFSDLDGRAVPPLQGAVTHIGYGYSYAEQLPMIRNADLRAYYSERAGRSVLATSDIGVAA
jgi:hypothetical protein